MNKTSKTQIGRFALTNAMATGITAAADVCVSQDIILPKINFSKAWDNFSQLNVSNKISLEMVLSIMVLES